MTQSEIVYTDDGKFAYVDGHRFTRDKRTGYYLSSRKIGASRMRLHVYVWMKHNGGIPSGYHVHHVSHDKSDNEISNLALVVGSEHLSHHGKSMTNEQLRRARRNLMENAIPKASEWHKSDEGRAWHSEHGKRTWEGKEPKQYACSNCGKPFESMKQSTPGNMFCSNSCKSAFRRKSGVDDISFPCASCGEAVISNKYLRRKRCMACGSMNDVPKGAA